MFPGLSLREYQEDMDQGCDSEHPAFITLPRWFSPLHNPLTLYVHYESNKSIRVHTTLAVQTPPVVRWLFAGIEWFELRSLPPAFRFLLM